MSFSPQLFLSNINAKDGLAKNSRFEVILPIPQYINNYVSNSFIESLLNLPNNIIADITDIIQEARGRSSTPQSRTDNPSLTRYLALQCESAELPGRSMITADAKIYGPTFKVPYQTQYQEITLNFICTNEFYERKLFDKWMEAINPPDTWNFRFPKGRESRYLTNLKIIQYDDFIRQIYAVELIDAFPVSIASQNLAWSEEGFHRLSVQFSYQYFKPIYQGNYDLIAAGSALLGSQFINFVQSATNSINQPIGTLFSNLIR
jgi:hypothetical protein